MKAIHIVAHVGNAASGPSYSVPALGRAMGAQGCDVTLMTQAFDPIAPSEGFRNLSFPQRGFPQGLAWSPELGKALGQMAPDVDVIHNNGIWLAPNMYPGFVARRSATPLVLAPRGTLSEAALEKSRWKKRMIWPLQRETFRRAACLHATADKEYDEIRAFGLKQPVAVIPNGIDLPEISPPAATGSEPRERRTLLFLGRIHPIKGLELLLEVWRDLPTELRAGWTLRIVGDDSEGFQAGLEAMVADQAIPDVSFPGPAYGDAKTREYAQADLYILPTKTENFGMTVAEALAAGTPVITTRGAPWSGLEPNDCGWWVERSKDTLTTALCDAMARPRGALAEMGAKGRDWVHREFGWPGIAAEMIALYRWLVDGQRGPAPASVRMD